MSSKTNFLIVVDKKDKVINYQPKLLCHQGRGVLHRAFSILIFNNKGELLLQKRSLKKSLWPGFWSNTCCSHAQKGKALKELAQKRLKEEMGFSCPLKFLGRVCYQATYSQGKAENEITYVFVGHYQGKIKPNKEEVMAVKWMTPKALLADFKKNGKDYTPWLKLIMKKIKSLKSSNF